MVGAHACFFYFDTTNEVAPEGVRHADAEIRQRVHSRLFLFAGAIASDCGDVIVWWRRCRRRRRTLEDLVIPSSESVSQIRDLHAMATAPIVEGSIPACE